MSSKTYFVLYKEGYSFFDDYSPGDIDPNVYARREDAEAALLEMCRESLEDWEIVPMKFHE